MTANVFTTPLQIHEAVVAVFPDARCEGVVGGSMFSLRLTLPNMLPITVDRAVDALQFVPAVRSLASRVFVDRHMGPPVALPVLDMKQFSLSAPLKGWQHFQRLMYEQGGGRCEDVLISYLGGEQEEASVNQLEQLGLAPHQVSDRCAESDLGRFQDFVNKLETLPRESASFLFAQFEQRFPTVFAAIVAKWRAAEESQGHHGYEETVYKLKQRVVGQDTAAEFVAVALCAGHAQEGNRTFLFVGPSGVGKTEMAKAAAALKQGRFITFPMHQYQTEHDGWRLFGPPPGIVGSEDTPLFVREVEKFSPVKTGSREGQDLYEVKDVVVLFDELEKAHANVRQYLLNLLNADEGYCDVQYVTSRPGKASKNEIRRYLFRHSIFIGTSNLFQEEIVRDFQAHVPGDEIAAHFKTLNMLAARSTSSTPPYSQELLGRVKIVPFGPIPKGEAYQKVLNVKMDAFFKSLGCQNFVVEDRPQLLTALEERLYGDGTDLRKIANYFNYDIRQAIYSQRWGDLGSKQLIVTPSSSRTLNIHACFVKFGQKFPMDGLVIV